MLWSNSVDQTKRSILLVREQNTLCLLLCKKDTKFKCLTFISIIVIMRHTILNTKRLFVYKKKVSYHLAKNSHWLGVANSHWHHVTLMKYLLLDAKVLLGTTLHHEMDLHAILRLHRIRYDMCIYYKLLQSSFSLAT